MDNDNFSFLADAESSITGDKTEGYTPKEQELIHQLVQERLGKKNAIEFESLDDYVVPPKMFFSMIKKQFVHGIMRTNQLDTSKTYILSGEYLEEKNTAVFSLVEGVSLRIQKGMTQS